MDHEEKPADKPTMTLQDANLIALNLACNESKSVSERQIAAECATALALARIAVVMESTANPTVNALTVIAASMKNKPKLTVVGGLH